MALSALKNPNFQKNSEKSHAWGLYKIIDTKYDTCWHRKNYYTADVMYMENNYTPAIFRVNGVQRLDDKDHNAVCNSRRLVHSHDIEQVWECHILHRRLCPVWHAVLKWQLPCHIEGKTMPTVQHDDPVCTSILKGQYIIIGEQK